jgi:hypothetical protein
MICPAISLHFKSTAKGLFAHRRERISGATGGRSLRFSARKQLVELIAGATSLQGDFFRSVAFRYFHPNDVISGEGTRLNDGRFVPEV